MMPDGDTAAHLRKQVGGLFLQGTVWRRLIPISGASTGHQQAQGRSISVFV
jgi:hypothetical protein